MPTTIRARLIPCAAALAVAVPVMLFAARPVPDKIPATGGDITIAPINHATLQITQGAHVIDVDPVAAAGSYEGLATPPTIILITDIHTDHLDVPMVATRRTPSTIVVAPQAAAAQLKGAIVMANGETKTVDGLTIEAVPMYNLKPDPKTGQLFHEKGRGNGYIITMGGKRIYIAGDTEGTPEMRALKNIDVAFVPMNLPYTMTPAAAADAVKAFKPKIVYPYHYKGQNPDEFAAALKGTGIDVRIRDWYAK